MIFFKKINVNKKKVIYFKFFNKTLINIIFKNIM